MTKEKKSASERIRELLEQASENIEINASLQHDILAWLNEKTQDKKGNRPADAFNLLLGVAASLLIMYIIRCEGHLFLLEEK